MVAHNFMFGRVSIYNYCMPSLCLCLSVSVSVFLSLCLSLSLCLCLCLCLCLSLSLSLSLSLGRFSLTKRTRTHRRKSCLVNIVLISLIKVSFTGSCTDLDRRNGQADRQTDTHIHTPVVIPFQNTRAGWCKKHVTSFEA